MKLPSGTVSFESISEERLLGKVDCEPRVVSNSSASGEGGGKGGRVSVGRRSRVSVGRRWVSVGRRRQGECGEEEVGECGEEEAG